MPISTIHETIHGNIVWFSLCFRYEDTNQTFFSMNPLYSGNSFSLKLMIQFPIFVMISLQEKHN